MPIIDCPNCRGKLRFPEDSPPRRVKCPTCGHIFLSSPGPDPAAPAAPGPPGPREPKSDRDERQPRRRDDDDRQPRRRDRDDDDEDRRSRRRRDDDDDDRRSRRGRREPDEDDDDDRRRPRPNVRAIEDQFNRASVACLLCFIAGWLLVAALALLVFARLLFWAEIHEGLNVFLVVAGLLGLGHLLTAAVGYGFLVSGPRERGGLGLAIATAGVAAFHLILTIVLATTETGAPFGDLYMGVRWTGFATQSNALGEVLYLLIGPYHTLKWSPGGRAIMAVFVNLAEVALVVLLLLTLRAAVIGASDRRRARTVMQTVVANAVVAGVLVVGGIIFGVLFRAVETEKGGMMAVDSLYHLVVYLVQAGITVWTTLVIKGVKDSLDYRPD
jgi:hypothetical protein